MHVCMCMCVHARVCVRARVCPDITRLTQVNVNIGNGVQQKETQYDHSEYNAGFGQQHLISDLVLQIHTYIQLLLYHCMPYLALKSFKVLPP